MANSLRLAGYKFPDEDLRKDMKGSVRLHIRLQLAKRVFRIREGSS